MSNSLKLASPVFHTPTRNAIHLRTACPVLWCVGQPDQWQRHSYAYFYIGLSPKIK